MSRKDKHNRNSYFPAKQDSVDSKFDINDEDFETLADASKKRTIKTVMDEASKVPIPVEFEEDEGNRWFSRVAMRHFLSKIGTFLKAAPGVCFCNIKTLFQGLVSKTGSLFRLLFSFLVFWKRKQTESLTEPTIPSTTQVNVHALKKNPEVMDIAEMPIDYQDDEDGRYFGNWLSIAGKTTLFAASVLVLVGIYFGGKTIYKSYLTEKDDSTDITAKVDTIKTPDDEQVQTESVLNGKKENKSETSQTDLLAALTNKQADSPKPKETEIVSEEKLKESDRKIPDTKLATAYPVVASNTVKRSESNKQETNVASIPNSEADPFKEIAKDEPNVSSKQKPKDVWLTDTQLAEKPAVQSQEPLVSGEPAHKAKTSELPVESPKKELAMQSNASAASDPWGTVTPIPEIDRTNDKVNHQTGNQKSTTDKTDNSLRFPPMVPVETHTETSVKTKAVIPTELVPIKQMDTADSPSMLKPLKTVDTPPTLVATDSPAPEIPKQTFLQEQDSPLAARTFKTPSVPPAMSTVVPETAQNSIAPVIPQPNTSIPLSDIPPAIPPMDNIQNFAVVKNQNNEKRPAIPTGDVLHDMPSSNPASSGAVKFQSASRNQPQNQNMLAPPVAELADSSPLTASSLTSSPTLFDEPTPAIPRDDQASAGSVTNNSLAMSVPATLPHHMELAKVEPPVGSQLQNEIQEHRNSGTDEPKINFGDNQKRAIRYSPTSVSYEPLSIPTESTVKMPGYAPLPMPILPDDPQSNNLLSLLPNNSNHSSSLPPLENGPPAMIAPVNPGYRRTLESQMVSSESMTDSLDRTVVSPESKAISVRQKLDEITKSPQITETYTIQPGDNYYTISERFFDTGLLFRALAEHNRQRFGIGYRPEPGTVIEVPTADYLKSNYTEELRLPNRQARTAETLLKQSSPFGQRYIVREGDTVFGIATNVLRDTPKWKEIVALNQDRISNPRQYLRPGIELILPQ